MELFHVLNRGVDKRIVFTEEADRMRFMQGLYVYNDHNLVDRNLRRHTGKINTETRPRVPLVHLHAYCLMSNHYHLLVSPVDDNMENISLFMRKLNMGYSKYFNEKYDRVGALWQGKYKAVHIKHDAQLLHIPFYIHLNPLDASFPEWRLGKIKDTEGAHSFLNTYRWSSFLDYNGQNNYPSLISKKLLSSILGSPTQQKKQIMKIINDPYLAESSNMIE